MIYIVASIGAPNGESHRWLTTDIDIKFKRCELVKKFDIDLPLDADVDTILHEHYTRKYPGWAGVVVQIFEPESVNTLAYQKLEYLLDGDKTRKENRNLLEQLMKVSRDMEVPELELHREAN